MRGKERSKLDNWMGGWGIPMKFRFPGTADKLLRQNLRIYVSIRGILHQKHPTACHKDPLDSCRQGAEWCWCRVSAPSLNPGMGGAGSPIILCSGAALCSMDVSCISSFCSSTGHQSHDPQACLRHQPMSPRDCITPTETPCVSTRLENM